jgi:endosialidase-like protein
MVRYRPSAVFVISLLCSAPMFAQGAGLASPMPFIPITPCRVVDTRGGGVFTGAYGLPALVGNQLRNFDLNSAPHCPGIPFDATAYSLNFTVVNTGLGGDLRAWPKDHPPVFPTSILNWTAGGTNIANAIALPGGTDGSITVMAAGTGAHLLIDVNGYFAASGTGANDTFLGPRAGNFTTTGGNNTAVGIQALEKNSAGGANTAVGAFSLVSNTTGDGNVGLGFSALFRNESGALNTAVGGSASSENVSGSRNAAVGWAALSANTGGNDNVAVGFHALVKSLGSGNIGIGPNAGENVTTGNNNIYIGSKGGGAGESGQIRIGDATLQNGTVIAGIFGGVIAGDFVVVNSGGRLGSTPSSRRFKDEIRDVGDDSDILMKLRPVAFRYKPDVDPEGLPQYGLIAEEVADVFPQLVGLDSDGRPVKVRYQLLDALLLNELQRQHRLLETQRSEIEMLKARLADLETRTALVTSGFGESE